MMECCQKIRWALYSSLAAFLMFLSITEVGPFSAVKKAIYPYGGRQKYVIVFDGGSTGTRIHVFSFLNNTNGFLLLENAYFQETKPGLSYYENNPQKAAESVKRLLEKAKALIPTQHWFKTPVALKATAGLRLLPTHVSNSILNEVSVVFKKSPFRVFDDSAAVLNGEDEGVFAWYTLNFLLGYLDEPSQSIAALDLGGGSTQVTFSPNDLNTIVYSPVEYIIKRRVHDKFVTLYSHSYLGLGLMSARLSILQMQDENTESANEIKSNVLRSVCMLPKTKSSWKHGGVEYIIKGSASSAGGFQQCYNKAVAFLGDTVDKPEELRKRDVYALSYYFDRAVDLGLIDESGGIVTVNDFMTGAAKACSKKESGKPFLCLDATYIAALLHHGLGLSKGKEIKLVKQIGGIEASWGLGAAFSMLQQY